MAGLTLNPVVTIDRPDQPHGVPCGWSNINLNNGVPCGWSNISINRPGLTVILITGSRAAGQALSLKNP